MIKSHYYLIYIGKLMASREIYYEEKRFTISYEIVNPSKQEAIVILHGWGSNKEIMKKAFGTTLKKLKHIYIDMPGFGKSSNDMVLETRDYAIIIQRFLNQIHTKAYIIMGHSFGGKVATLMDSPNLVLLSSSGILVPKPIKVKFKIAMSKTLKALGLKGFTNIFRSSDVKGMNHNMYQTFKHIVDEKFEDNFKNSHSQAILFWGKYDTATPLWTATKIEELLPHSKLYTLDGDHFFFLKYSKFISDTITRSFLNDIS